MNNSSNRNVPQRSSDAIASSSTPKPAVTSFSVRLPKNVEKKFNVMKFSDKLNVDFKKWTEVEMARENNSKDFKQETEKVPEFGAGSLFGHKDREEARRKRFERNRGNYNADEQPWILNSSGDSKKKYKGDREGIGENSAYYVFTHGDNGTLNAYPLQEWYNFQSLQQRFKPLTCEEAEEEYKNRAKCHNLFSIMLKKRMSNDNNDDEDEEVDKDISKTKKSKGFKVSEVDEQIDSSNESLDEESDDSSDENSKNRKKNAKNANNKKKPKRDTEAEALEESDDGDDEGRECDYDCSSSDSSENEDEYSLHGVSEEKGLKVILDSDEDDSEDEEKEKEAEQNIDQKPNSSDFSSDSDSDKDSRKKQSNPKIKKKFGKELVTQICKSVQNPSSSLKRNQDSIIDAVPKIANKKPRTESAGKNLSFTELGITEEAIRKYLTRKPITMKELILKFKLKNLNNDERKRAEAAVSVILKKINPKHQVICNKMYLHL